MFQRPSQDNKRHNKTENLKQLVITKVNLPKPIYKSGFLNVFKSINRLS